MARERGIDIELAQLRPAIVDDLERKNLEALQQGGRVGAPVGLDHPDDDVRSLGPLLAGGEQHGVGLADPGGRAEEDLQPATPLLRFLALHASEKRVGIPPWGIAHRRDYRRTHGRRPQSGPPGPRVMVWSCGRVKAAGYGAGRSYAR